MTPSGIIRDSKAPFRTRKLKNGTVVIEDAYEGRYIYTSKRSSGTQIKGLHIIEVSNGKKTVRED